MASVSNGKRHVIKRKQTREKVCGLCLNANSCNMQNQNKYFGNSQSFSPLFKLNFRHCICVAIFIILESQSEKLWHQNGLHENAECRSPRVLKMRSVENAEC